MNQQLNFPLSDLIEPISFSNKAEETLLRLAANFSYLKEKETKFEKHAIQGKKSHTKSLH